MTLAPQTPESLGNPAVIPSSDLALLRLCSLLGAGIVRVEREGLAWPLNEAGAGLLEALGGGYGLPAPELLRQLLDTAQKDGPQQTETVTHTPEARHIAVAASQLDGYGLTMLRDKTDERLLHERLLQSEKMASVGQLVSGVAHELNNPLTGVMGFAQLLLGRDLDESARVQVQTIYAEAERASKIVQNLLTFARRRRPSKEMADINALVQRVLELCSYDFGVRNISLDLTLDTRMDAVWADPDQVQQVLFNVIKNAEQSMIDSHGGGTLAVVTRGSEHGVRISIADDGSGIPPEIQRRIFDPVFTTKNAGEGTGLGLTICYGIIEDHSGRIWTENRPEAGALFQIELPFGAPDFLQKAEGGSGQRTLPASTSARRVLVVDDEVSIRLLLHDILHLDQHSVALASNGVEAAGLVENEEFDVIITDLKMPGMDGASFYRQVRERDPAQAGRIIFITGDTVSADTRAFLQRVSNPVLAKPFKIGPLRDAIESVLSS
jgi:two-component system, NtrC family, sensor kinase